MDFDPNEDFDFGAGMPDSDEENVYATEKEYDAANDETFGGDVGPIPEDLSAFAADTLAVELENSSLRQDYHGDHPGPSTSSQEVHKRPTDLQSQNNWSDFQARVKNPVYLDDYQEQAFKHQQEAVRATQALWNDQGFSSAYHNRAPSPPHGSSSNNLRGIPGSALTLDEIEHQQLMQTGAVHIANMGKSFPLTPGDKRRLAPSQTSEVVNAPHFLPSDWIHPSIPDETPPRQHTSMKKSVVTAEELERRLLDELNDKKAKQVDNRSSSPDQHPSHGPPFNNIPPGLFPPGKMPTPMQMAQMQQQLYHQWQAMAAMASGAGVPPPNMGQMPPGFPPMMPPFAPPNHPMYAAMMAQRMQMGHGSPGMGMPPPGFMPPPPMNHPPRPGTPNNRPFQGDQQLPFNVGSPGNRTPAPESPFGSTTSLRRIRKEGMPSLRTITDYACDPYAGFMSKKEREWLIKIQLIQCLGTGDKYTDDYYYTCWKKDNTLEKRPDAWKQPKIRSKYYNLEETYPSNYTPPTFSGVLGKPSSATTSFPRQALDFQPGEDDVESIIGGTSREINKRKLRTILLTIENGFLMQLECDELLRKIPTVSPEEAGEMLNELYGKLNSIYNTTMDENHIPTTMVIAKGRRLCIRILSIASSPLKAQIISNVFNALRKYSRKVSISPNSDFIQAALKALLDIKDNDLKIFFDKTDAERFQDTLVYSSFSQNLTTALLIACAKRAIHIDTFAPDSSFIKFLRSERKMYNGLGNAYTEIFSAEDLNTLKTWLQTSTVCSSGNVAGCFLVCLREKNF